MRKVSILLLALTLVVGFTFLATAGMSESNMEKGLERSPAFEDTSEQFGWVEGSHFTHKKGAPRFDTKNGKIANGAEKLVDTEKEDAE